MKQGKGCRKCKSKIRSNDQRYSNEEIDAYLIENNRTIIRIDNYISANIAIKWKCLRCSNIWNNSFSHIKNGEDCAKCRTGWNELLILNYLINNHIDHIWHYKIITNDNTKFFIDFYLPQQNLFIEYNGAQHYRPVKFGGMALDIAETNFIKQQARDTKLREYCQINSINLLEIDGRIYTKKKLQDLITWLFNNKYLNKAA